MLLSSAAPIWQHLRVRRTTYENLKGLAQLHLHTPQGSGTVNDVVVVLERFDGVRLEGIGPLGQALFLLVSDGHRFSLYFPQERRVISGPTSTQQLLLGLQVAPKLLPYLLVGDVPLTTLPETGRLSYLGQEEAYLWEGDDPQEPWHYRIWFDPYRLLPVRCELATLAGEIVLQVTYADFRHLDGLTLPYQITLTQPSADREVQWSYSEVQINAGVTSTLFHLRLPPGVERVELE
jgi:outer membrane lipoprotein-sorting protein